MKYLFEKLFDEESLKENIQLWTDFNIYLT